MTVVVAGQFPPPIHGMSVAMAAFADLVGERRPVVRLDLSPGDAHSRVHHHLRRVRRTASAVARLVQLRRDTAALFVGCDAGLGMLYTATVALAGRILGMPSFVHHHSYAYVTEHSRLAAGLVRVAGPGCCHLLLCDAMRREFSAQYPRAHVDLLSCGFAVEPPPIETPLETPALDTTGMPRDEGAGAEAAVVLGHLSNLRRTKGLDTVFDTVDELDRRGVRTQLVLAGPPASPEDGRLLEQRLAANPDARWMGPVSGDRKHAFFAELDYFLLPSRYSHEAAPLVALEALAAGVPVVAFGRGCLADNVADPDFVIDADADFVTVAADLVQVQAERAPADADRAAQSRARFDRLHAESVAAADRLLADLDDR